MAICEMFTLWDWGVLFAYLLLTTWIGHLMRGKQGTIRDFFLGGRSLPWPAVTGSMIATEISGVTFIGVPATLFYLQGDFTYLQWAIGSILARFLVAWFFVKAYYEKEIYSPYDFIGQRLGRFAKQLTTLLFVLGGILGQSVRVMVAALPLMIVTGLPFQWCILIIGVFAIIWTLMGGMQTVIWTDVMQFFLFLFGGGLAFVMIVNSLPGGWGEMMRVGAEFDRTRLFNFEFGWMPAYRFTFWVAIFAVPFQNLAMFGVDQLNAQRMFCCRNESDARKALIFSSFGQVITLLMLFVGLALFVYYQDQGGWSEAEAGIVQPGQDSVGAVAVPGEPDAVFPMWIVTHLPLGLRGLVLAGVFAAAISSLDSILAALSQTTLSVLFHPEERELDAGESRRLLIFSKVLVGVWGLVLSLAAIGIYFANQAVPLLPLAFGMTAYTAGPLLGIVALALLGRGGRGGILIGTALSLLLTLFVRTDLWALLNQIPGFEAWLFKALETLPTYWVGANGTLEASFYSGWMWPLAAVITFASGWFWPAKLRK